MTTSAHVLTELIELEKIEKVIPTLIIGEKSFVSKKIIFWFAMYLKTQQEVNLC